MASSSPNIRTTQTFYLEACLTSYRFHGGEDVDALFTQSYEAFYWSIAFGQRGRIYHKVLSSLLCCSNHNYAPQATDHHLSSTQCSPDGVTVTLYCIRCYVTISVCVDINVINKRTNRNCSSELHFKCVVLCMF